MYDLQIRNLINVWAHRVNLLINSIFKSTKKENISDVYFLAPPPKMMWNLFLTYKIVCTITCVCFDLLTCIWLHERQHMINGIMYVLVTEACKTPQLSERHVQLIMRQLNRDNMTEKSSLRLIGKGFRKNVQFLFEWYCNDDIAFFTLVTVFIYCFSYLKKENKKITFSVYCKSNESLLWYKNIFKAVNNIPHLHVPSILKHLFMNQFIALKSG